jgi:hypothetical protein
VADPRRSTSGRNGDHTKGREPAASTRFRVPFLRAANDNRMGVKGWARRIVAAAALVALAALVAWRTLQ